MAKQRHNTPPVDAPPSRSPLVFLAIGALLVAGLVGWALTRTVESPAPVASTTYPTTTEATSTTASTTEAPFTMTPPVTATPFPSTTAGITTSSQAPVIQGDKSEVARISAEDLREKVNAHAVTVIDVRDASAFEAAHIPGSLHIPMASIEANLDRLPKGKPIVTYCT
ncbi:MAG TPA: rhodanese-like domain-containing protein [Thermoanaerobaculia bacterium]